MAQPGPKARRAGISGQTNRSDHNDRKSACAALPACAHHRCFTSSSAGIANPALPARVTACFFNGEPKRKIWPGKPTLVEPGRAVKSVDHAYLQVGTPTKRCAKIKRPVARWRKCRQRPQPATPRRFGRNNAKATPAVGYGFVNEHHPAGFRRGFG